MLEAAIRTSPDRFTWRTETYEFVDDPIAIDLLTGSSEARAALETHVPPRELVDSWQARARCVPAASLALSTLLIHTNNAGSSAESSADTMPFPYAIACGRMFAL